MFRYHKRLCCYITAVCKKRVKTVLETSPADVLQPFKDRMEEFLERGMATQSCEVWVHLWNKCC